MALVEETVEALREVGAVETATVVLNAAEGPPSTMNDTLFCAGFREDLTMLNAAFARRNRSRCPALNGQERQET